MNTARRISQWMFWSAAALAAVEALHAEPVISEFLASNRTGILDEDGDHSDWIELRNPDPAPASLKGWYLTDSATNKIKWPFPDVSIPAGGYLVVFASGKDRRDPTARLHTNFSLDADGDYLALVRADGSSVATEFAPKFPKQQANVSYGPAGSPPAGGAVYLEKPTPGAGNSAALPMGIAQTVTFSRPAGPAASSFQLTLSGADSGQQIRYVTAPSRSGATLAGPDATSPVYSAPITIDGATVVKAALFTTDGKTRGPTRTVYYSRIGGDLSGAVSELPVVVIDTLGSGPLVKDGIDRSAWLHSYAPRAVGTPVFATAPELTSPLTIKVRGSSSAEFPKKGYGIAFTDELGSGDEPAWLDLGTHERWALSAPWKYDLHYINNAYVYTLSTRLGRWAPRTRLAELYLSNNGGNIDAADYAGIYVITDRIEVAKKRVDIASLNPDELTGADLTGGYILKIDAADPDEVSWSTSRKFPETPGSSVVLVSPAATDIAPAQLAYIKDYVQRMEDALIASRDSGWARRTYLDFIDRGSWVDQHLLQVFSANPDALVRSTYLTKDRNGRLVAGPAWDFDRALGSYWDERSFRYDTWFGVGGTDFWQTGWWGILARDPEFMQEWIDRWQTIRRTDFSNDALIALVDTLTKGVAAAAGRDAARWPDNASPYGSYTAQLNRLKGWSPKRAEWIDQQFTAPPSVFASGGNVTLTAPAGAELIYTLDGSDPRSLGGGVAPNARRTSAPLTVASSTNVVARSYLAASANVFPGSPWSSAVGGPASTPVSPASRLVNLSSRALVSAGENALIVGVVVADTAAKRFLLRGVGPALGAFGLSDFVREPRLSIFRGATEIAANLAWETGPDASRLPGYAKSVGAFALPAGSRDSALVGDLGAGAYTVQVTTTATQPGVGLAELYELDALGRSINLSTRARVAAGSGALFGGFVVQGAAAKRMLVRAAGPALAAFGISGFLREPILTVYNSRQAVVATNEGWDVAGGGAVITAAGGLVGAFPLAAGSRDAALLLSVPPGAYTVEIKGKDASEGVALLEIYEVP
jgi:hypothetical protein